MKRGTAEGSQSTQVKWAIRLSGTVEDRQACLYFPKISECPRLHKGIREFFVSGYVWQFHILSPSNQQVRTIRCAAAETYDLLV